MSVSDEELFNAFKIVFNHLPNLFFTDVVMGLADREKYVLVKQASTFQVNLQVGQKIAKGEYISKAIEVRKGQVVRYSKEQAGCHVVAFAIPIINQHTGNVIGAITYAMSQDKEQEALEMAQQLQTVTAEQAATTEELAKAAQSLASNSKTSAAEISEILNGIREDVTNILEIANEFAAISKEQSAQTQHIASRNQMLSNLATQMNELAQNLHNC